MAAKQKQNIIAELTTLPPGYVLTWYKHHCMAAITPVQSESSWAFLPSCTANKSCSDGWQEDKSSHKSLCQRQQLQCCSANYCRQFLL